MRHKAIWFLSCLLVLGIASLVWADDPTSTFVSLQPLSSNLPATSTNNAGQFEIWDSATGGSTESLNGQFCGVWFSSTPMPTARQEISTAAFDGKIFVMGGFDQNQQSTDTVEVFDPKTVKWTTAASLPIVTNHNAAAVAAGTLYAFGGTSNRVFTYDRLEDSWSEVAPMNYQHGNTPAAAVIDDQIYVAGGTGPGMVGNEVEVYDPSSDTWTVLTPMNVPRNHTAGGAIGRLFYVVGGRPGADAARALEAYNPETDTWTSLSPMPTARSGIAAGVVNGKLYVFGGEQPRFDEVEAYNPNDDSWQRCPPMATPRHGIFASVLGDRIFLPGGATQQVLALPTSMKSSW